MRRRAFLSRTVVGTAALLVSRLDSDAAPLTAPHPPPPRTANLLRNGNFQDDWLTLLPQNQTLHWAYANTFYSRRDFNPDGWSCTGSWQWIDADKPRGSRRLVLRAPKAQALQRLHWFAVHDEAKISGFPDAGGFPELQPLLSRAPEQLVRDLALRVGLRGQDVPLGAGSVDLGLTPLGKADTSDSLGSLVKPLVSATTPILSETFDWQQLDVRLPASDWLKASQRDAAGALLPAVVSIAVHFEGRAGQIELGLAELSDPGPAGPNLVSNGGFEGVGPDGYPTAWERPVKYRHFPPKHYYLFNTWHDALFDNRGRVETDVLVMWSGTRSLKMIVPSGDGRGGISSGADQSAQSAPH